MKNLALAAILLCSSITFAAPVDDVKNNIRRLTDRIYNELNVTKATLEDLEAVEENLLASLSIIRGEEVPPSDNYNRNSCLKYILDQGFGTSTARETCDSLKTNDEFTCVQMVVGRKYSPRTATENCMGILKEELVCFQDILERNYPPSKANELCVVSGEE